MPQIIYEKQPVQGSAFKYEGGAINRPSASQLICAVCRGRHGPDGQTGSSEPVRSSRAGGKDADLKSARRSRSMQAVPERDSQ